MPNFQKPQSNFSGLFKENPQANIQNPDQELIRLKKLERAYLADHNKLVSQLWDIDLTLAKKDPKTDIDSLMKQKQSLSRQIDELPYNKQLEELSEKIQELELKKKSPSPL